jgi:hypothetical protein
MTLKQLHSLPGELLDGAISDRALAANFPGSVIYPVPVGHPP